MPISLKGLGILHTISARNWERYYPTILYFISLDFLYNMLYANYPLWKYTGLLPNHTFNDIFVAIFTFPCIALIYLPYFPQKITKIILYILAWTVVYAIFEYTAFAANIFIYFNGWNIWWSLGFDAGLFTTLILHHRKPKITWPLTAIGIIITMVLTHLPINSMN